MVLSGCVIIGHNASLADHGSNRKLVTMHYQPADTRPAPLALLSVPGA
jgi:hypothetical protein